MPVARAGERQCAVIVQPRRPKFVGGRVERGRQGLRGTESLALHGRQIQIEAALGLPAVA
ncbi:hypothetical protein D3C81_1905380 [compost metagenome]